MVTLKQIPPFGVHPSAACPAWAFAAAGSSVCKTNSPCFVLRQLLSCCCVVLGTRKEHSYFPGAAREGRIQLISSCAAACPSSPLHSWQSLAASSLPWEIPWQTSGQGASPSLLARWWDKPLVFVLGLSWSGCMVRRLGNGVIVPSC